ncbi:MAG: hypothetical protein AB7O97_07795 [Planctomycetota bacterium]
MTADAPRPARSSVLPAALALLVAPIAAQQEPAPTRRDWSAAITHLRLDRADPDHPRLLGPGVERFHAIVDGSTVLMFGEQHGIDGIAELTQVALARVQRAAPVHLVLETGAWIAGRCAALGEDAEQAVRRFPHSFTFDTDGDLGLLRQAARGSAGREFVGGIDQMSTAIHPLQRLVELAPDLHAGCLARGAFLKAALRGGRYSRQDHARDLDALRAAFGPEPPDEVRLILDELAMTQRIFGTHLAARRGELSPQVSVTLRERHMDALFDAYLARNRVDGAWPRMVFKMGGAHVMWGIGPNGIDTLGEHVRTRAAAEGVPICHVGVSAHQDQPFPPKETLRPGEITMVDCAAARAVLGDDGLRALPDEVRLRLQRFDHLLVLNGAGRAPDGAARGYEAAFRRDTLWSLLPLAIPLVVLLTGLWPLGRALWRRLRGRPFEAPGAAATLTAALCVPCLVLARQLQLILANSDRVPAAIDHAGFLVAFGSMTVACAVAAVVVWRAVRRGRWGRGRRAHALVLTAAAAALVAAMVRCNLGGMLGT